MVEVPQAKQLCGWERDRMQSHCRAFSRVHNIFALLAFCDLVPVAPETKPTVLESSGTEHSFHRFVLHLDLWVPKRVLWRALDWLLAFATRSKLYSLNQSGPPEPIDLPDEKVFQGGQLSGPSG